MTIPYYNQIMLPLLQYVSDEKEHPKSEVIEYISNHFRLTPEERNAMLPSGKQKTINNIIGLVKNWT